MGDGLDFLIEQLKEAKLAMVESLAAADRLGMSVTSIQIREALGYINGILEEIVPFGESKS